MSFPLSPPTKEIDVAWLVFVERYATDLVKWDILTLFAHNPELSAAPSEIANRLGRSIHAIRPELGDLAILGILSPTKTSNSRILYRLTADPYLRKMVLKFAKQGTLSSKSDPWSLRG